MTDSGAERSARRVERKYEHLCDCGHHALTHQEGGSCRHHVDLVRCKCNKYTNADENISVAAIIREETGTQTAMLDFVKLVARERCPNNIIDEQIANGWATCTCLRHRARKLLPAAPDEGEKR